LVFNQSEKCRPFETENIMREVNAEFNSMTEPNRSDCLLIAFKLSSVNSICSPSFMRLLGDQVSVRNVDLLLASVAGQFDDLHAIAQWQLS
jgi:hypothetical protein